MCWTTQAFASLASPNGTETDCMQYAEQVCSALIPPSGCGHIIAHNCPDPEQLAQRRMDFWRPLNEKDPIFFEFFFQACTPPSIPSQTPATSSKLKHSAQPGRYDLETPKHFQVCHVMGNYIHTTNLFGQGLRRNAGEVARLVLWMQ